MMAIMLSFFFSQAQITVISNVGSNSVLAREPNRQVTSVFVVPVYNDTATALTKGLDSLGMLIQIRSTGDFYRRDTANPGHKWTKFGAGGGSSSGGNADSLNHIKFDSSGMSTDTVRYMYYDRPSNSYKFRKISLYDVIYALQYAPLAPTDTIGKFVTSLMRSHDSVYYKKGSAWVFGYRDSIGTGGGGSGVNGIRLIVPSALFVSNDAIFDSSGGYWVGSLTLKPQSQNLILGSPDGVTGVPTMRAIVDNDLPVFGAGAGTCTNCNVTFDSHGREVGYSSGSNISSFWTPETFGGIPDGVTDCTIAIQRAIDSAALTKGTVLLSKGTYMVRCAYRDTAVVYKPDGLHLRDNVTIDGPGVGAVIKIAAPPASSTFVDNGAPFTFTTNTKFFSLFRLDSVSGVTLKNFSINGNVANQINRMGYDPYKNPQDITPGVSTTLNTQTNGIDIRMGSFNTVYNVRIDSISGYNIRDSGSTTNLYDHITATTGINGGVYYSFADASGSIVSNSLITNSWCDNIRIRTSNVSVLNNEVSLAKFNVNGNGGSYINFANIYFESGSWGDVKGIKIIGNYIHDASAFGIDGNITDTVRYTYPGQSALIANNNIEYNGAGGIQLAMPFVTVKSNIILNNGKTSSGIIDSSASQCKCSIHTSGDKSFGAEIVGNSMRDTRKVQSSGGLSGNSVPFLTFRDNSASGMSLTNSLAPVFANGNNVGGNTYLDTANIIHADDWVGTDGARHLTPNLGQNGSTSQAVYIGDGSNNASIIGNYKPSSGTFAFIGQLNGSNMMRFDLSNTATFTGSTNASSGRNFTIGDAISGTNFFGVDSAGSVWVGSSNTVYSMQARRGNYDISTGLPQVLFNSTSTGSTANTSQSGVTIRQNAGYTGAGYPEALNVLQYTASSGNTIAGAGTVKANFGAYNAAIGAPSAGSNIATYSASYNGFRNVGLIGDASYNQYNSTTAQSIGVVGFALRNNASALNVGGAFFLQASQPTFASAAILADNGATSDPIALFRANGVNKVQVGSTGNLLATASTILYQLGNTPTGQEPSITAGAGAGTSPTVTIVGGSLSGDVTVTTGTAPTGSNATILTLTYPNSFATGSFPVFYPANAATAALTNLTGTYSTGTTNTALLVSGSSALTASTVYKWHYVITGY